MVICRRLFEVNRGECRKKRKGDWQIAKVKGRMSKQFKQKGKDNTSETTDAVFLGSGVRAIARKSMLPGDTVADLEQFLVLLYGMFDEKEAKQVSVFDPFAESKGRRITIARLAGALEDLIERTAQKSA